MYANMQSSLFYAPSRGCAQIRSAGLEFRVPTSAVGELPHFGGEAATLQVPSAARNAQPPQRRWFEFARRQARLLADSAARDASECMDIMCMRQHMHACRNEGVPRWTLN